jgi:hypothetical protein
MAISSDGRNALTLLFLLHLARQLFLLLTDAALRCLLLYRRCCSSRRVLQEELA